MSDRELLELAAIAARIGGSNIIDSVAGPQIFARHDSNGVECYRLWDPLDDDADAFRLAIKVGLCITIADGQMLAHRYYSHKQGLNGATEPVSGKADNERLAAFRRAIVRAAAEIGSAEAAADIGRDYER